MSNPQEKPPISFNIRIIQHKDDPTCGQAPQELGIDSAGQERVPASWETLGAFAGYDEPMEKSEILNMIPVYEMEAYSTPEHQTSHPKDIWIYDHEDLTDDDDSKPTSPYQKYGWQPVSIKIEPNKKKKHEKWKTKKRLLDIEEMETEQCPLWDPTVDYYKPKIVSEFKRSGNPIFGNSFAPPITFEFRGYTDALGLCCLAPNDRSVQKRTIDWVLYQHGGLAAEEYYVNAIKHTVRGKLKYNVIIEGVVAGDMSSRSSTKFKQFPIDFVFKYNGIEPNCEMYEEFELIYYTNITVSPLESI